MCRVLWDCVQGGIAAKLADDLRPPRKIVHTNCRRTHAGKKKKPRNDDEETGTECSKVTILNHNLVPTAEPAILGKEREALG
jgi:hypothetical protein